MAEIQIKVITRVSERCIWVRLEEGDMPELMMPRCMIRHGEWLSEGERDLILDVSTMLYAEIKEVIRRAKVTEGKKAVQLQREVWDENKRRAGQ